MDWISEVVSKLYESKIILNLSCAAVVAVILVKADLDIDNQTVASLLNCLAVSVKRQACPNYATLCSFFSPEYRKKEILSALYKLCSKAIAFCIQEFILAIPLVHFLSGATEPFERIVWKKQLDKKLPLISINTFRVQKG